MQNACAILEADALTREQYAHALVQSEPGSVQAGVRGARNSPVEQPGDESGRSGAPIPAPTSGPTEFVGL